MMSRSSVKNRLGVMCLPLLCILTMGAVAEEEPPAENQKFELSCGPFENDDLERGWSNIDHCSLTYPADGRFSLAWVKTRYRENLKDDNDVERVCQAHQRAGEYD